MAVAEVKTKISVDDSALSRAFKKAGQDARAFASIAKSSAFTGFAIAASGVGAVALALGGVTFAGVRAAAQMETLQAGFKVFLGSAALAKQRMADLAEFSKRTPAQLPELAAMSQSLQVLTQGLLDNQRGWQLVGDVASGTGRRFEDMAQTIGRLFAGLRSGTDVGDSLRSLQEAGALSPQAVRQIHGQAGVDGAKAWQMASDALARFSGQMEEKSHTFEGLMSTFHDQIRLALSAFGMPILEQLKPQIQVLTAGIEALRPKFEAFGKIVANIFGAGVNILENAMGNPEKLLGALKLTMDAVAESFVEILSKGITLIGQQIAQMFPGLAKMAGFNPTIAPSAPDMGPTAWMKAADAWKSLAKNGLGSVYGLLPQNPLAAMVAHHDMRALHSTSLRSSGLVGASMLSSPAHVSGIAAGIAAVGAMSKAAFSPMGGLSTMGMGALDQGGARTVRSLLPLHERRQAESAARAARIGENYLKTGRWTMGDAGGSVRRGDNRMAREYVKNKQSEKLGLDKTNQILGSLELKFDAAWGTGGAGGGK